MQVQNFDQAIKNTLRTLTFDEKSLAQDLFSSRQYDSKSLRAWIRAPTLTLSQAIAQARDTPQKTFVTRFIEIYCDTITIDTSLSPNDGPVGKEPYSISIFARKLLGFGSDPKSIYLTINILERCEVAILTPQMPSEFDITFVSEGKTVWQTQPVVQPRKFGVFYSYNSGNPNPISVEQVDPPDSTLDSIDYLGLIQANGTVQDKGFLNDDLPRLLQMQLLVAQANSSLDRQFAVDVLNYVVAASETPYNIDMNYMACSLRNSLSLNADAMAVPSVNIYSSKQVLKARLLAALAFENSFRDFSAQSGDAQYQVTNALNLLAKSDDALETYAFLHKIRTRDYDSAVVSQNKASATFNDSQAEIKIRTTEFQAGVQSYKKDEERKAIFSCIVGIVEVIGAIAATVATGGAAAPAVAGAAVNAAKAVGKVAALIAKLKAIFEKLKEIFEKIKPVIEKLQALVKTAKSVIENLRKLKGVTDDALALQPAVKSTDVINATAEWRRFSLEIASMEDSIKDYAIDGKQPFFMALKKLVINGETFLLAQANLVQKGDELTTLMLQRKMEQRDKGRLSSMVYNISATGKVLELLRRAMFERLLAIRGMVYLDFSTYCSAYNYHTLRTEEVVNLSPVKPVSDFLEDAARLQSAVVSYGSRVLVQSRTFTVRTLGGYETAQDLAAQLAQGGPLKVTMSPDDPIWQGFSRIRVSVARCFLEGVKISAADNKPSTSSVRLQLTTDGRFYDIQDKRTDFSGVTIGDGDKSRSVRSFIGDPRRLLFEYQPTDNNIICDGLYGQKRDYTQHTPLTTWEITLASQNSLASPTTTLDFSEFTGIRLEFVCNVVWSDL